MCPVSLRVNRLHVNQASCSYYGGQITERNYIVARMWLGEEKFMEHFSWKTEGKT